MSDLLLEHTGAVARVTLNRPAVHNAFNAAMIADLARIFAELSADPGVRVVVLAGAGPSFCAGADIHWMQESLAYSEAENLADAQRLALMLRAIDECTKPVVALVQGAALGGGAGLVAVADLVLAEEGARFGLTEIKLGIVPAVISPFVLRKMLPGPARALFLTGERFSAARAYELGLVTTLTPAGQLEEALAAVITQLHSSSPAAVPVAKEIWRTVRGLAPEAAFTYTTGTIARIRVSPEGQEGLRAFLEKRRPQWTAGG
ncbi:MAG TPA: enoyl-CoA hydratase-related protein [Chloroflexia bacterium]|nr:enoyl-CoA hydratase-related protein [Chloroflexia bacterium]